MEQENQTCYTHCLRCSTLLAMVSEHVCCRTAPRVGSVGWATGRVKRVRGPKDGARMAPDSLRMATVAKSGVWRNHRGGLTAGRQARAGVRASSHLQDHPGQLDAVHQLLRRLDGLRPAPAQPQQLLLRGGQQGGATRLSEHSHGRQGDTYPVALPARVTSDRSVNQLSRRLQKRGIVSGKAGGSRAPDFGGGRGDAHQRRGGDVVAEELRQPVSRRDGECR